MVFISLSHEMKLLESNQNFIEIKLKFHVNCLFICILYITWYHVVSRDITLFVKKILKNSNTVISREYGKEMKTTVVFIIKNE